MYSKHGALKKQEQEQEVPQEVNSTNAVRLNRLKIIVSNYRSLMPGEEN